MQEQKRMSLPGFNGGVQGILRAWVDGSIEFYTYEVQL
jgi:hypothetical protein